MSTNPPYDPMCSVAWTNKPYQLLGDVMQLLPAHFGDDRKRILNRAEMELVVYLHLLKQLTGGTMLVPVDTVQ